MSALYLPLMEPDVEILIEMRYILLRHLHDAKAYPSKYKFKPVQQQIIYASPYDETLYEPPCVIPRVNYITLFHDSAHHDTK